MCAGTLIHNLDIWVRRVIIIIKVAKYVSIVCFAEFTSIGFYIEFLIYDRYYIIAVYILLYHLCSIPPVSCTYLIIPWVFPAWYHLLYNTCSCMLVVTTRFSMYVYDSDLSIHVCLSMNTIWHSHHHSLGSSNSLGSSCLGLGAWSLWILPVADQSGAAEAGSPADSPEPHPSRPPGRL